jgi:hypothetical protein
VNGSWTLVRPGRRYRKLPALDDPTACELRALAARDRAADQGPADWSAEERDRWLTGRHGFHSMRAYYDPARWPERIEAPMAWRDELVVIFASVALTAFQDRVDSLRAISVLYPTGKALDELVSELRRRSARHVGLTAESVPPASTVHGGWLFFAGTIGPWTWRKLRGERTPSMPWEVFLAMRLILAVNERRSWREASIRPS